MASEKNGESPTDLKSDMMTIRAEIEAEFGAKRAQLMELYQGVEQQLERERERSREIELRAVRLQNELDECRSLIMVANCDRENTVENERRRCQEEIASLQHIMREQMTEAHNEIERFRQLCERYEEEGRRVSVATPTHHHHAPSPTPPLSANSIAESLSGAEGMIASVTKSLKQKVVSLGPNPASAIANAVVGVVAGDQSQAAQQSSAESLEDSMRKAKEDAEMLRSLVVPLEEEITQLKKKIRLMDAQIQNYRRVMMSGSAAANMSQSTLCGLSLTKMRRSISTSSLPALDLTSSPIAISDASASAADGRTTHTLRKSAGLAASDGDCLDGKTDDLDSLNVAFMMSDTALRPNRERSRTACKLCSNYEIQLQQVQCRLNEYERSRGMLETTIQQTREQLERERSQWKEAEQRYADTSSDAKHQIDSLTRRIGQAEHHLAELSVQQASTAEDVRGSSKQLQEQLRKLTKKCERLKKENDTFLGLYCARSQDLNRPIDLPQTVDEMHIEYLKLFQQHIEVIVAKELLDKTLRAEVEFAHSRIKSDEITRTTFEEKTHEMVRDLQRQISELETSNARLLEDSKRKSELEKEMGEVVAFRDQLVAEKSKLEKDVHELRQRIQTLQGELDNSEEVQKDFVRLSQNLQVELEKIRTVNDDVRWQHEDDVTQCGSCSKPFHNKKEKQHCAHCGHIFCASCNSRTVQGGPRRRSFHVCAVCHTLLDRKTAPYFSNQAPSS